MIFFVNIKYLKNFLKPNKKGLYFIHLIFQIIKLLSIYNALKKDSIFSVLL